MSDLARLRQATVREAAGDLNAAERIVKEVLDASPSSLTALSTLSRLLELQGRRPEVLPYVERLLALDPASVIGHQLHLRVSHEADDRDRLQDAVAAWIDATPHLETPYRESAVLWRERGEHARGIAVLEQGRSRIDMPDALALELGDAHAASGDVAGAAAEWSRAIGPEGRGFMLVQRRLQQLPDGGAGIIPRLVEYLSAEPVTLGRRKAAAVLAIDAGLDDQARRLTRDLAVSTPPEDREPLLVELARRADGAGLYGVARWAYAQILADSTDEGAMLAVRMRIAELALLEGDTALAAETYEQLERAWAPGSPQRRQAIALRVQLNARNGDLVAATADYESFRSEYPQATELDETANTLALRHVQAGDAPAAERVLAGVKGPLSARTRGRLHLRRGDIEKARDELLRAAPQLRGAEATETIALAALLTRLSPGAAELVASVSAAPDAERPALIDAAAAAAASMAERERGAIFEFLASIADRSDSHEAAAALRRTIVEQLPDSHEAPAALLALALRAAARPGDEARTEARLLLERLIVDYPRSALAPRARNELQRMQEGS